MSSILPIIDAGLPTGVVEPFASRVAREAATLTRSTLIDLQINLGKLCNQTCTHCHVDAGPTKNGREHDSANCKTHLRTGRQVRIAHSGRPDPVLVLLSSTQAFANLCVTFATVA